MSSGEEDNHEGEQGLSQDFKKRRIQRACDTCRRKKIRCDGGQMPGNRCSNCSAYNLDCTYVEAAKKRGPPKGYVESLENRLENMEKLLQRLCPDADFTQELGPHIDRENWSLDRRGLEVMPASDNRQGDIRRRNLACMIVPSGPPLTGDVSAGCYNDEDFAASEDELGTGTLAEGLKRLAVDPLDRRFHGKSSGVMLVQTAMNLKQEYSGGEVRKSLIIPPTRRPEFWSPHPWEIVSMECGVQYLYPPDDLLPILVDNYFQNLNPYLPLLHRPSFERALADRRHHTDVGFGSVVMLVCSIGARWSEDRRCCLEGTGAHSAGWKWFDQVQVHRKSFMGPPRLYDLQIYALSSLFLQYSSSPQSSWTMVGIGLRLAQDVGAHRRKVYNAPLSVESELWKRAFWVLVSMDRFGSAALGRPCAIQDEDFDLELPLEVDDEYWEHPDPTKAFKQPPGIPCSISYFISFLKLNQILAFALRTIYSINKSKILLGFVGPQWEQHIVAELDSALNKWIDTVPDHLRWDPHRENALHFNQSATLYATYYHLQILIHRPFIPSPRKPSPLAFPSLAICTNAARSCSHVTDICRRRGVLPLPQMQIAAFSSGIVLLLNIWGAKKSGTYVDTEKQMSDVRKCMNVLRSIEGRFISAGRLWDILNELACAGDIPLDKATPPPNNKRERGSDSPISNEASPSPSQVPIQDGARPVAGRRNLSAFSSSFSAHAAASSGLPYDTEQLSRANPELVPNLHTSGVNGAGNNNNNNNNNNSLSVPWLSSTQVPGGGGGAPPPTGSNSVDQMFGTSSNVNGMPNLNIFDLFQSDPQMFNVPMLDNQQGYHLPTVNSAPTQGMGKTSSYAPETEAHGSGFGQLDGSLPSEALQMWSTAPTSFDLEDWGSYLHNVNGSSAENVPAQRG